MAKRPNTKKKNKSSFDENSKKQSVLKQPQFIDNENEPEPDNANNDD